MLYLRGNRLDYDHWSYLGNYGWSYQEVLPYFIAAENNELGSSTYHGVNGPLTVRNYPNPGLPGTAFVEAAIEYGFAGPDWDIAGIEITTSKASAPIDSFMPSPSFRLSHC